jgi:two-component system OmpR family response regulator
MITEQAGAGRGQRILLIDGDPAVGGAISRALGAAGCAVDAVTDPVRGLQHALAGRYDLIIVELCWPQIDGREVLARLLRGLPQQAVLVLSRVADVSTKVECLELGARDYLTKPFSLPELAARVRVQLRAGHQRSERTGGPGLVIDVTRVQADAGIGPVPLTRTEFLLLMELRDHPGASVSKKQLLEAVWDLDFDPGSNVVDVCVRRLRSKLGTEMIKTIRGSGYQLLS